jgi:phage shock protein E
MPSKGRQQTNRKRPGNQRPGASAPTGNRNRLLLAIGGAGVALVAVVIAVALVLGGSSSSPASSSGTGQTTVEGNGGQWANVTPDRLAEMMQSKDFTLVNVKTPYVGEIDGTDLYIPYDQLASKVSLLPAAKTAKILVYCRSGAESAVAAQTLLGLGYTNVWNLDGGMNAWQSSGRTLVQKNRS